MRRNVPQHLYLIHRGPQYADPHQWCESLRETSVHMVIVCTRKATAKWEAGDSGEGSTVWVRSAADGGEGWLLTKWRGLDVDYGHLVRGFTLPDGSRTGFFHPGNPSPEHRRPWDSLNGAIWWSDQDLPAWLAKRGVRLPTDRHTLEAIYNDIGRERGGDRDGDSWVATALRKPPAPAAGKDGAK